MTFSKFKHYSTKFSDRLHEVSIIDIVPDRLRQPLKYFSSVTLALCGRNAEYPITRREDQKSYNIQQMSENVVNTLQHILFQFSAKKHASLHGQTGTKLTTFVLQTEPSRDNSPETNRIWCIRFANQTAV